MNYSLKNRNSQSTRYRNIHYASRLSSAYASISKDHYCKSLCLYFWPHNRKQEKKLEFQVQSYLIQIHFMKAPEPIK